MLAKKKAAAHPEYDHLLTRLLHVFEGFSAFSFFLMLTVALLYLIGNLQSFTIETQETLLAILQATGYAAVGINLYAILMIVLWSIRHRRFLLWRLMLSLLSLVFGFALTLSAAFISLLLRPSW
jgi:hypothetical protein